MLNSCLYKSDTTHTYKTVFCFVQVFSHFYVFHLFRCLSYVWMYVFSLQHNPPHIDLHTPQHHTGNMIITILHTLHHYCFVSLFHCWQFQQYLTDSTLELLQARGPELLWVYLFPPDLVPVCWVLPWWTSGQLPSTFRWRKMS